MDAIDRRILTVLQADASLAVAEIATRVGLSATPCWRRIQNLEKSGVIRGRVALLHGPSINLGVTVFVALRTSQHDDVWLKGFTDGLKAIPEVVEFYRLSGEVDYLLKVLVSDIEDYDRVYKRLIAVAPLTDVSSSFAMETIKATTVLPLDRIPV